MCTGISFIRAVVPMQKQNVHAQFSHISGAINAIYIPDSPSQLCSNKLGLRVELLLGGGRIV